MNQEIELEILSQYLKNMLNLISEVKVLRETNKCLNAENQEMRSQLETNK